MRRLMMLLIACCLLGQVFSQNAKKETVQNLNVQGFGSAIPLETKSTIDPEEELSLHNLRDFKYTLEPQQSKDYREYQVIKLDGLSNSDLVIGMITNTLDRESRFIEINSDRQAAIVREILSGNANYVFVHPVEKSYFIASDGTFRYVDGRELVGDKKVLAYLEKGKPITATTFYYALKDRGLIGSELNLRNFISMSLEEKVKLLNMDIHASVK